MKSMGLGTGWGGQACCEGMRQGDPGRTGTTGWLGAPRTLIVPSAKASPGVARGGVHLGALKRRLCAGLASLKGCWEGKPGEGKKWVPLLTPPTPDGWAPLCPPPSWGNRGGSAVHPGAMGQATPPAPGQVLFLRLSTAASLGTVAIDDSPQPPLPYLTWKERLGLGRR